MSASEDKYDSSYGLGECTYTKSNSLVKNRAWILTFSIVALEGEMRYQ